MGDSDLDVLTDLTILTDETVIISTKKSTKKNKNRISELNDLIIDEDSCENSFGNMFYLIIMLIFVMILIGCYSS